MVWLTLGSIGSEVLKYQKIMRYSLKKVYYPGKLDNNFGPLMFKGVKDFQTDNKLKIDGIIGNQTGGLMISMVANNPLPNLGKIKKPVTVPVLPVKQRGPHTQRLENMFNVSVRTPLQLYKWFWDDVDYFHYRNSRGKIAELLKKIHQPKTVSLENRGVNCVDGSKIARPILQEQGFECDFLHVKIKCSGDKTGQGHVMLRFRGPNYPVWTIFDHVGATHHSRKLPLGSPCCSGGYEILEVNPKWLLEIAQ